METNDMKNLNNNLKFIHESFISINSNYELKIKAYKHGMEIHKQREELINRRLNNAIKYLEKLGLDIGEINSIIKLDEEEL